MSTKPVPQRNATDKIIAVVGGHFVGNAQKATVR